jgi:hypothetical protein
MTNCVLEIDDRGRLEYKRLIETNILQTDVKKQVERERRAYCWDGLDGEEALSLIRKLACDRPNTAFLASPREVPVLVQLRWLRIT